MKMIFRQALEQDVPAVEELLGSWIEEDQGIGFQIGSAVAPGASPASRCRVLEVNETVRCVSLWQVEKPDHVQLTALGLGPADLAADLGSRFLREQIMEFADLGVSRLTIRVPEKLAAAVVPVLKRCGFIFEGICCSCCEASGAWVTFCKHFLYRSIFASEVMGFFQEFLLGLGYEVRRDGEGFSYRVRSEFGLPFVFSAWHRVTMSGPDLIVQPPARVLEWHELETLFYPFRVEETAERPLLVPLDRKTAEQTIDLPLGNNHQDSLFHRARFFEPRPLTDSNVTYVDPTAIHGIRKGLPLLFYVNRVGAVGTARVQDWVVEDSKALHQTLQKKGWELPAEADEPEITSWPRSGKVMAVRFHWYRALQRPVKLDEIRALDKTFSPQRVRCLSSALFQSLVAAGTGRAQGHGAGCANALSNR